MKVKGSIWGQISSAIDAVPVRQRIEVFDDKGEDVHIVQSSMGRGEID